MVRAPASPAQAPSGLALQVRAHGTASALRAALHCTVDCSLRCNHSRPVTKRSPGHLVVLGQPHGHQRRDKGAVRGRLSYQHDSKMSRPRHQPPRVDSLAHDCIRGDGFFTRNLITR